jgi:hypothetical protein
MTVARKLLEIAAFWDQNICLDCETIQPPEESEEMPPCVKCGSGNILAAETVLQIADMVDSDDEG